MSRIFYFAFVDGEQRVYCESCAEEVENLKVKIKLSRRKAKELILLLRCDGCGAEWPFERSKQVGLEHFLYC
jgi:uncharacterized Zn finger protein